MRKIRIVFFLLRQGPISIFRAMFDKCRYCRIFHFLNDKHFLKLIYLVHFGKVLNTDNPKTFNEKLQFLKLHNRKKIYNLMVDKCTVKNYVSNIIGDNYIIKTLGVWKNFDEIDFNALPNKFVLKCNHDSGSVIICKDKNKLDKKKARQILSNRLNRNLFYWGREWPYKDLTPCIIAEELIEDNSDGDLKDYKFFCFDGIVKCFKIDFGRFVEHHANYYDTTGNLLPISEKCCKSDPNYILPLPNNFNTMILLAEKLSKNNPFLRVDFYNINGKIYFGELTLFPASGLSPFTDIASDELLGSWLNLHINE